MVNVTAFTFKSNLISWILFFKVLSKLLCTLSYKGKKELIKQTMNWKSEMSLHFEQCEQNPHMKDSLYSFLTCGTPATLFVAEIIFYSTAQMEDNIFWGSMFYVLMQSTQLHLWNEVSWDSSWS